MLLSRDPKKATSKFSLNSMSWRLVIPSVDIIGGGDPLGRVPCARISMACSCAEFGFGNPALLNGTALVDGAADAWATGAAEAVERNDAPAMAKDIREYIMIEN